ncbi:MAG TPA: hypothetical protein PLS20_04080 [Ruminococcus flavefaciens]|nr:hypothetical protein [Ruminococcus flavefaciens]
MAFCKFCGKEIPEGGACDCAESIKDAAASAVEGLKEKAENAAGAVKDKAEDAAEAVKDKAEDAVEAAKDKAEDAAKAVKDKVEDVTEAVTDKAEDAVEAVKDKAEDVKEDVKDAAAEITKSDKKDKKEKKKKEKKSDANDGEGKKKGKTGAKVIAVLILAVLLILGLLIWSGINSIARKKPVKQYVKGINKTDIEMVMESIYPEEQIAVIKTGYSYDALDSEKSFKSNLESTGFKKAKVKFLEGEKLKDEDFDRAAEYYNSVSGGYGIDKAYRYKVEVTVKTKKGKQPPRTGYVTVVKLEDDDWKYLPYGDSSGLSTYFSLY